MTLYSDENNSLTIFFTMKQTVVASVTELYNADWQADVDDVDEATDSLEYGQPVWLLISQLYCILEGLDIHWPKLLWMR